MTINLIDLLKEAEENNQDFVDYNNLNKDKIENNRYLSDKDYQKEILQKANEKVLSKLKRISHSLRTKVPSGQDLHNKKNDIGIFDSEYIVIDLETTGFDPVHGSEIIEIGVTEIKNNKIVRNYSRLIKPKSLIPANITKITNITNDMVSEALSIEEVLPNLRNFIGNRTIIAHNAKFDLKFLNFFLKKQDLPTLNKHICTLELLKKNKLYTKRSRSLKNACDHYDIENISAHRAYSDTLATAQIFLIAREEIKFQDL